MTLNDGSVACDTRSQTAGICSPSPAETCPHASNAKSRLKADNVHGQSSNKLEPEIASDESIAANSAGHRQDFDGTSAEQQIYVDWDGSEDPSNPRNWSSRKKWSISSVSGLIWTSHDVRRYND